MANFNDTVSALFDGQDPQLVLLDLDGTLIDSVPDLTVAVDTMLQALGRSSAGIEAVSHWIGNGADMLVRRALAKGDENAALALNNHDVANARHYFDSAYLATLHNATGAFSGAHEFLLQVSQPKVLITNKPRLFTLPLLRSLGWENLFSQILCGDDLTEKKPSPIPLQHACTWHCVDTSVALMIGDSRHDIQAAQAAGISSVAVTYGYNHGDDIAHSSPDLMCHNLMDLMCHNLMDLLSTNHNG